MGSQTPVKISTSRHFNDSTQSPGSTLRKSLGVLFGYEQISGDSDPITGKTKFNIEDEQKSSEWMLNNLVMYFLPTPDLNYIESELINHFNPPLNLKDNSNIVNLDFGRLLSSLRANKIDKNKE